MRYRVFLAILLLAACIYPKDNRAWKQGAVLDIYFKGVSRHGQKVMTYRIDGAGETCSGEEVAKKRPEGVTVNGLVEYDVENGNLYIKDSRGKTHKLKLLTNSSH